MPFWRRKPLHERLAEEGGLLSTPHPLDLLREARPSRLESGIHGVPRPRQWDAVVTAAAPELPGAEVRFTALPDGALLVDEDLPDGALTPLAEAVEQSVEAPYRAEAVRRHEDVWAVAARRIDVIELEDDPGGDVIDLAIHEGERTLLVDDARTFGSVPALERLLAGDGVVRAERLDGPLFEVTVTPL
jgi:hypothetical protein